MTQCTNLTNDKREAVLRALLVSRKSDLTRRQPNHVLKEISIKFNCSARTVQRIWSSAKEQGIAQGNFDVNIHNKKKGRVGRKVEYTAEVIHSKLIEMDKRDRTSFRTMSEKTGISVGTLHNCMKNGMFRSHTSAIKPSLTPANMLARVDFALKAIDEESLAFMEMSNIVHLDEKWYFLTKTSRRFYLLPGEKEPVRRTQSKRYIGKIMFLSAVSRPCFSSDGSLLWDGKLGTWTFVTMTPALYSSRRRPKGTLELKPVAVTRDVYREKLLQAVIPAIVQKWPTHTLGQTIVLQHDNALAHVPIHDPQVQAEFNDLKRHHGWSFWIVPQPPNSPDLNVLDLGFFASIQALQHRKYASCLDELISNVVGDFGDERQQYLENPPSFKRQTTTRRDFAAKSGMRRHSLCHTKSKLSGTIDLESMLDGVVQEARLEDELSSQLQSIAMEFDVGAIENALNELHIVPITLEEDESTDGIADGLRPLESLPSENETEEIWKI
ncbi:hypothetical protein AeRB84_010860 [Aphanomyces euteiches]|nr:hypothetical protein AeRB84_010860 [Aphanomyces euteiches]